MPVGRLVRTSADRDHPVNLASRPIISGISPPTCRRVRTPVPRGRGSGTSFPEPLIRYGWRMAEEAVLVALPGTMCSPAVFDPLAQALAGELVVDAVSWLTQPGPWDIPAVADRVADHIERSWGRPVLGG